jgi:hypothetical protein
MKNLCGKTRKVNEPYEVWRAEGTELGTIEWRVLKKWQADDNKPYARWMVAAKSDATFGSYDVGDEYVENIKRYGQLIWTSDAPFPPLEKW